VSVIVFVFVFAFAFAFMFVIVIVIVGAIAIVIVTVIVILIVFPTWYHVVSRGYRYDRRDPAALGAQFTLDVVEQVYNAYLDRIS
jgi:hypothetical protein